MTPVLVGLHQRLDVGKHPQLVVNALVILDGGVRVEFSPLMGANNFADNGAADLRIPLNPHFFNGFPRQFRSRRQIALLRGKLLSMDRNRPKNPIKPRTNTSATPAAVPKSLRCLQFSCADQSQKSLSAAVPAIPHRQFAGV